MDILVCIKRVPATGARIVVTEDGQELDTRHLGFTISPHEECAVEEAVRLLEAHGGTVAVLTLGPAVAVEQLRDSMAVGIDRAILLGTDGQEWDPISTAMAIVDTVRQQAEVGQNFDLLLFGNESADSGGYQVGLRVAHELGLPCVVGIKSLAVADGTAVAKREIADGHEVYEVDLPAVFTVKEGINLPRYPSLPGKLKAKKKPIAQFSPEPQGGGLTKLRLKTPREQESSVQILGEGPAAAKEIANLLRELKLM
jgi:electron transfer flavoprotein beta subunit